MQVKPQAIATRGTLTICLLMMLVNSATAETVTVKYRGDVPLDTFQFQSVDCSSLVKRICYDASQQYMVISLNGTYYNDCEIDQGMVDSLLTAQLMGKYFNVQGYASKPDLVSCLAQLFST